jgi:transcriptional regulator with XRE-family HTH domain
MAPSNRLTILRQANKWSQRELAQRLAPKPNGQHLHERTICRWEAGESQIPDERKAELADVFGVSVAWLMGWEGNGGNGETRSVA